MSVRLSSPPRDPNQAFHFHFWAFKKTLCAKSSEVVTINRSTYLLTLVLGLVAHIVSPWQSPAYLSVLVINASADSGLSAAACAGP